MYKTELVRRVARKTGLSQRVVSQAAPGKSRDRAADAGGRRARHPPGVWHLLHKSAASGSGALGAHRASGGDSGSPGGGLPGGGGAQARRGGEAKAGSEPIWLGALTITIGRRRAAADRSELATMRREGLRRCLPPLAGALGPARDDRRSPTLSTFLILEGAGRLPMSEPRRDRISA